MRDNIDDEWVVLCVHIVAGIEDTIRVESKHEWQRLYTVVEYMYMYWNGGWLEI